MYRIVTSLAQPYTLLFLLLGLAVANLWRKRRESRRRLLVLTSLVVLLGILSTPVVGAFALRTCEGRFAPLEQRPGDAEAIVVLAGAVSLEDETGGPAQMEADTVHRCLHAAELYRQGAACLVLVSGGKVSAAVPGPAFARVMQGFLIRLGVRESDLLVEDSSRTTHENAVESRRLLDRHHIRKIVLVTDALHMGRALRCFRKQGLEVVPAPCYFRGGCRDFTLRDLLPAPSGADDCRDAVHEWLGVLWYQLQGRL
jgi:uncharacterized SAM-binding protein YcdF (DUF218 family)